MKLYILTENMAGGKFLAEHGLSYLVELNGEKVLFDTGNSDVFFRNALNLGMDLQKESKKVILSHGHWDHGNGLKYLNNKDLICHPGAFIKRFRRDDNENIGLELTEKELNKKFNLIKSDKPYEISKNFYFLGEIPRLNDFESQSTYFVTEEGKNDFVPDDSALAIVQNNKLYVISACSHAGICNIVDYAIKVTGVDDVSLVIGGFHLKQQNEQALKTVNYLNQFKNLQLYPSHCTELPALALFYEHFKIKQVRTGMILKLDNAN